MISVALAESLKAAGLPWRPASGDRFVIPHRNMDETVFHVSEMTIEVHEHVGHGVVKFNGTTEWALDSAALADALWLPLEHQLRALLGGAFAGLAPVEGGFEVRLTLPGAAPTGFVAHEPADAYADALLALIAATR